MRKRRLSARQRFLLFDIAVVAFLFRAFWLVRVVFGGQSVNFQAGDAQYHLRLIENVVHNFPWRVTVDPYMGIHDAPAVPVAPLFDFLVAGTARLIGWGSPSPHTLDVIAALAAPLLAAVTITIIALLGARLFGAVAGLIAAALLAIMPGQFLLRSILGNPNHHVLEALLSTATILALVSALNQSTVRRTVLGGIIAGCLLGAYLLAWSGAALLVFILCLWAVSQYILNDIHARHDSNFEYCVVAAILVALILVLLGQDASFFRLGSQLSALLGAIVVLLSLSVICRVLRAYRAPRGAMTAATIVLMLACMTVFFVLMSGFSQGVLTDLHRFDPGPVAQTVTEIRPLLTMTGRLSFIAPFFAFGPALVFGLIALGTLIVRVFRDPIPCRVLCITWSIVMLGATLGQNRFGYYLAPILALHTGWLCARCWQRVRIWSRRRRTLMQSSSATNLTVANRILGQLPRAAMGLAIIGILFIPSLLLALPNVKHVYEISPDWQESLNWLRDATPQPFSDPNYYLARYRPGHTESPRYTVMAWWDFGYDIIRLAQRVPVTNPTQTNASIAGKFFTAIDENEAMRVLDDTNARYVLASQSLVMLKAYPYGAAGMFRAMTAWAGVDASRYIVDYQQKNRLGKFEPLVAYTADYYNSMAVRLYVFAGQDATPSNSTYVIRYIDRRNAQGTAYREVTELHRFANYDAALAYMRTSPYPATLALVGIDPLRTAVPVKALRQLHLVYQPSPQLPLVRIFEYVPIGSR